MRRHNPSPLAALASTLVLWAAVAAALGVAGRSRADRPESPQPFVPDINRAPARHLLLLPGIGPARARAIVHDRRRDGPFRSLEEIRRVHGIGPATAAGLRGRARADSPFRAGDP